MTAVFHIKQKAIFANFTVCLDPDQSHAFVIRYQKHDLPYIYYLQSINSNKTPNDLFKINDFVKAKLPRPKINYEQRILAKIAKKHVVNRFLNGQNANVFFMTLPKSRNYKDPKIYGKYFPKSFQ